MGVGYGVVERFGGGIDGTAKAELEVDPLIARNRGEMNGAREVCEEGWSEEKQIPTG